MAIGAVAALGIWRLAQNGVEQKPNHHWTDDKVREYATSRMERLLRDKWKVEVPDASPPAVRRQFFQLLSQDTCTANERLQHPDNQFWIRLPQHSPKNVPHLSKDLYSELKNLAGRVAYMPASTERDAESIDEIGQQLAQLFDTIEDGMDFRKWVANQSLGQVTGSTFPWDEESPTSLRQVIVTHFLGKPDGAGNLRTEDVRTIIKQLNDWRVRGVQEKDAEERPWFVCHCYLAFLSQARLGAMPEEASWYTAFVSRLPKSPAINVADRECKRDFTRDALLPLAKGLGIESSDLVLTGTLLTDIADRLAYETWQQECDRQIDRWADKLRDELANAPIDCRKKMEERKIVPYGVVKIEVARDEQDRPTHPKIEKRNLEVRARMARSTLLSSDFG